MKRFASILTTLSLILAIFTTPAHAIPRKFKNCPQVKQDGITYLLYDKCAIVTKTPNRRTITIPHKIKAKGKTYTVRSIWENTFERNKSLRVIDLRAKYLECIEDPAIFDNHRIKVIAHDNSTYKWLKNNDVNVIKR